MRYTLTVELVLDVPHPEMVGTGEVSPSEVAKLVTVHPWAAPDVHLHDARPVSVLAPEPIRCDVCRRPLVSAGPDYLRCVAERHPDHREMADVVKSPAVVANLKGA